MTKSVKVPFSVSSAGATSATRYVGGTTTSSPTGATFVTGDFVIAQNGHLWICTSGGTPGTWVDVGSTAANVVTSANTTANKVTVSPSASPPSSPAVGDIWIKSDTTVNTTSMSVELDSVERMTPMDLTSIGTTSTFVDGLLIVVPAQTRPYSVSLDLVVTASPGTATAGTVQVVLIYLRDITSGSPGTQVGGVAPSTFVQGAITGQVQYDALKMVRRLPASTTERTFAIYASTLVTNPTNWTSTYLQGADPGVTDIYPPMWFRADTR